MTSTSTLACSVWYLWYWTVFRGALGFRPRLLAMAGVVACHGYNFCLSFCRHLFSTGTSFCLRQRLPKLSSKPQLVSASSYQSQSRDVKRPWERYGFVVSMNSLYEAYPLGHLLKARLQTSLPASTVGNIYFGFTWPG